MVGMWCGWIDVTCVNRDLVLLFRLVRGKRALLLIIVFCSGRHELVVRTETEEISIVFNRA